MYKPLAHIPPSSTQGHVCLSCRRYLHVARPRRSPTPFAEHNGGGEDDLFPLNDISSDYSTQANIDVADTFPARNRRELALNGEGRLKPQRRAAHKYSPDHDVNADGRDHASWRPLKERKPQPLPPRDDGVKSLLSKLERHVGSTDNQKQKGLVSSGEATSRSGKLTRGSKTRGELLKTIKSVRGEVTTQESSAVSIVPQVQPPLPDLSTSKDVRPSPSVETQLGSVVGKIIAARKAKAVQAAVEAATRTSVPTSRKASGAGKPRIISQVLKANPPRPSRAERAAVSNAKATASVSPRPASVELSESELIAAGDLLAGGRVDEIGTGEINEDGPIDTEVRRKPSPFPSRAVLTEAAAERQPLTESRLYRPVTHPREPLGNGPGQHQPSLRQLNPARGEESIAARDGVALPTSTPEHAVDTAIARTPGRRRSKLLHLPSTLTETMISEQSPSSTAFPPVSFRGVVPQSAARRPSNVAEKVRLTNQKVKWGGVEEAPRNASSFSASYDTLREADQVTPPAPPPVTASATKPWGMGGSSVFRAVNSTSSSAVGAVADDVSSTSNPATISNNKPRSELSEALTRQSGGFFSSLKARFLGSSKGNSTQHDHTETSTADPEATTGGEVNNSEASATTSTSPPDVENRALPSSTDSAQSTPPGATSGVTTPEASSGTSDRLAALPSRSHNQDAAATHSNAQDEPFPGRCVPSKGSSQRSGAKSAAASGHIEAVSDTVAVAGRNVHNTSVEESVERHKGKARLVRTASGLRLRQVLSRKEAVELHTKLKAQTQIAQSGCLTTTEPAAEDVTEASDPEYAVNVHTASDATLGMPADVTPSIVSQDSSNEGGKSLADAMQGADLPDALEGQQSPGGDSGDSGSSWPVSEDTDPDLSELEGCDHGTVDANGLEVTALDIEQPPVPNLSFGLERVLFNPGVYQLQDPHSRVYNFDPYLQNIMPVDEFDFNALKEYKTSSKDNALSDLALTHGKKYIGSTSSMTSTLGHFHYLLSNWRDLNLDMLSVNFPAPPKTFTNINRAPTAIFLKWKNGTYAIDADKEFDSGNVLMMLGKSMEKLLTLSRSDYERYRKTDPREIPIEERDAPEAFQYTTMGDFLMRSQLDAYDPRLPGTGMFDLKTRAVLPIRMDAGDYKPMLGYELTSLQGEFRSYEREYSDMLRSTMLKYMLQARMGRMDGIFLAYHNVQRIFGFQYLPMKEIDRAIHGQVHPCLGDQEFKLSLDMLNKVLEMATAKFPERSLRFHFETKPDKDRDLTALYVFAEPMEDEDIEKIQDKTKEKLANFEKEMMGFVKEPKSDTSVPASTTTDTEILAPEVQTDLSSSPLFAATLITVQNVNGAQVPRPKHLSTTDEWSIEYLIKPMSDPTQAWASYAACKARRRVAFEKKEEEEGEEKVVNAYFQRLRDMAREGREWRTKIDGLEAGREKVVLGMDGEEHLSEEVKDTESYMAWLYGQEKA
ncbi:hypothetical protein LTR95_011291 [Oleoguttula sp. CCFEE 5521]